LIFNDFSIFVNIHGTTKTEESPSATYLTYIKIGFIKDNKTDIR